ncbi:hypothetical protein GOL40_19435 [Sinorhizobium medicae]|nr:hypothetical protein [Sinorhizobium medicae]
MAFSPNAETVYADGPFGSPLQPSKPEIRSLLAQYEAAIDAYSSGAGSIAKSTRALLFADLAHAADVTAWVYADSTVAYNGIYRKSGASGAGSWSLILPLPFSFIIASDTGAGAANAIQATTSLPVSSSALVWMNIFEANTSSPVTVSFNGGTALTIKTNSGNDVAAGGLTAGMIVMGIVSGSTFRLVSDQASAVLVAQAEAAAAAALAAVPNQFPATRTALKAINTATHTSAYLREAGREGQFIWRSGDYSAQVTADTAEGIYIKADAVAATSGAWVRQGGWQIGGADVRWFGAVIDGVTDDAPAINAALSLMATIGAPAKQPRGTSMVGSTITLKNGSIWVGDSYLSIVKRLPGHAGALVKSENFDSLTGTSDAFAPGVPERVGIDKIEFDGNYQNAARTAYVQATGEGIRLFVRKPLIKVHVFNTPGVGVWPECPGGNGPTPLQPGFSREAEIEIYTHQTQYEGVVWKGPPDVKIGWILAADAASRIIADQLNGKVSSPTYGAVNGGQTFCVVFDGKGGEVGEVHAFGNFGGGGIDWRNGGRINADLLMAESCHYGGINITGSASGMISKLDVHRTGGFGGDSTADFVYSGTGNNNYGLEIGVCALYRQDAANTGSRNGLEITGDFIDIGVLKVDLGSTSPAGHGLLIDNDAAQWITIRGGEIARCKGTAPDGLASSGVYRKTAGNGSLLDIQCSVRDCDVAFRSAGTPRVETIDIQFFLNTGQLAFAGDARTNAAQKWDVRGTINGVAKTSKFMGASAAFNSNSTALQTLTVPHGLIYAPPFGKYHATGIVDTPTSMTAGRIGFVQVTAADATNVTVEVQMQTANGVDTAPRVSIAAEI